MSGSITLASFDVFDTLLTRAVGSPTSVFLIVGKLLAERGLCVVPPDRFARGREEAETAARRARNWQEVTLEAIYAHIGSDLLASEDARQQAIRIETEVEHTLMRTVPGARERVERARAAGSRVVFVSDMYLPGSVIRGWLIAAGLWSDADRLYVSNEEGVSKASGELFARLLAREGVAPGEVSHCGNHAQSDLAWPRRLQMDVEPFMEGNLNRYEEILESHSSNTGGFSSALAGASRLARLSIAANRPHVRALRDVSAGVVAPLLVAYVLWLLEQARVRGFRRLYFLARDGQILLDLARRLAPSVGYLGDLRYLYASRQAWHLPSITAIDDRAIEWICRRYDFLSIRTLLSRVDIVPEEIGGALKACGHPEGSWDQDLDPEAIQRAHALLARNAVAEIVVSRASARREVLIGYLRQEGLYEDVPWALVDVGWNGSLQASLGAILKSTGAPEPNGLYFALAGRPSTPGAGSFDAYLFHPGNDGRPKAFAGVDLAVMMEMACAADHGSAIGFEARNDRFAPILESSSNSPALNWGLGVMQQTVREFADHLLLSRNLVDPSADLRMPAGHVVSIFWRHPSREEARAWGGFPFASDQGRATAEPIARAYTGRRLIRALLGYAPPARVSFWQQGSITISPPLIRGILHGWTRLRRLRMRLSSRMTRRASAA